VGLIAPTQEITQTGQEEVIDGVRVRFQMVPGTEAPAEMHFLFPDRRALCLAENATHNLHNLLTLRGAQVRDLYPYLHDQTLRLLNQGHTGIEIAEQMTLSPTPEAA
jgi:alkyl sulfatase BDS1-like metallo-beta-lactamase superfamily hydrolase